MDRRGGSKCCFSRQLQIFIAYFKLTSVGMRAPHKTLVIEKKNAKSQTKETHLFCFDSSHDKVLIN